MTSLNATPTTNISTSTTSSELHKVPIKLVSGLTAIWVVGLLIPYVYTANEGRKIAYSTYDNVRLLALVALVLLAIYGTALALERVGDSAGRPYTMGSLVALVIFWGLAPPSWFFTEYYLFDHGKVEWSDEWKDKLALGIAKASCTTEKCIAEAKIEVAGKLMSSIKTYADMASKIWAAVGLALGMAIGLKK